MYSRKSLAFSPPPHLTLPPIIHKTNQFRSHASATFQTYVPALSSLTAKIPSTLSFPHASVLGLGLATASAGLYQKSHLALRLPSTSTAPNSANAVVILWGGSSSVGSCGIQLLKASGYEVFATASKRNLDYVKQLGADRVFDYADEGLVGEVVEALKGKELAGCYDAIGSPDTVGALAKICDQHGQGSKMIAVTNPRAEKPQGSGVELKGVFATSIAKNEVGPAVFNEFVTQALEQGTFLVKPEPEIVGEGLGSVQEGIDRLKKGVSASKLVVTL